MKRPLASVGMSFLLTLAVFCVFWPAGSAAFAALFAAAALAAALREKKASRLVLVLAGAALACLLLSADTFYKERCARRLCGRTAECVLVVREVRSYETARYVTAGLTRADGRGERGVEVLLSLPIQAELRVGDRVEARLSLCERERSEIGETLLLRAELLGEADAVGTDALLSLGARLRETMRASIESVLASEQAAVAAAVITGDKSVLTSRLKTEFSRAGISHILVISGLHITFLLMGLYRLLRRLRLPGGLRAALCAAGAAMCFVVYGAGASVVRAVVMCGATILGDLLKRRTDPLTSMSAAALILLVFSPRTAGTLSFLLSFGCCFALCAVQPAVLRRLRDRGRARGKAGKDVFLRGALAQSAGATVCVNAVTLPVLTAFGMDVSLVSPLANLPVLLLVQPMMISAFCVCLFTAVLPVPVLAGASGFICGLLARLIVSVARLFSALPFAAVSTSRAWMRVAVLCGTVLGILTAAAPRGKLRLRLAAGCTAVVLLAGMGAQALLCKDSVRVLLYEDSAAAISANGRCAVVLYALRAEEGPYLESWLKSRFIGEADYVIIAAELGEEVESAAESLAKGGQLVRYAAFCGAFDLRQEPFVLHLGRLRVELAGDGALRLAHAGAELWLTPPENRWGSFSMTAREPGGEMRQDVLAHPRSFLTAEDAGNLTVYILRGGRVRAVRE